MLFQNKMADTIENPLIYHTRSLHRLHTKSQIIDNKGQFSSKKQKIDLIYFSHRIFTQKHTLPQFLYILSDHILSQNFLVNFRDQCRSAYMTLHINILSLGAVKIEFERSAKCLIIEQCKKYVSSRNAILDKPWNAFQEFHAANFINFLFNH